MTAFTKVCFLDEHGKRTGSFTKNIPISLVKKMYESMVLVRHFDRKAISLQRQGRLGTYVPFEGQEAAQVGSAMALNDQDWLFPTYRDHAASITFGHSLATVLLYWNGRVEGCISPSGIKHNILMAFQMCSPVFSTWNVSRSTE